MTQRNLPHRYASLDGYRFLAASAVVLFHFNADFHLGLASAFPAVTRFNSFVDFFFMLSGFVIAVGYLDRLESWTDYAHFLHARFARIYPLHIVTLGMFLVFVAIGVALRLPPNHPEFVAMSGLPANIALTQSWGVLNHPSFNVPSWSISAEWFVYLAVPLFFTLTRRVHVLANVLLLALFVGVMIAFRRRAGLEAWTGATFDFGMLRAVPSFFLGILLAQAVQRAPLGWAPPWWSVHALFVFAIVLLGVDLPPETILPIFALLIVAAALADRGDAPSVMKGWALSALGQGSYALYMLHVLMSVPTLLIMRRLHLLDTRWAILVAFVLYVGVVLLSLASYRYFETPMRRRVMGVRIGAFGNRPRQKYRAIG